MKEIWNNIFVGGDSDFDSVKDDDEFSFVHCAKHPYHKNIVGYQGNLDNRHSEYLFAHRKGVLSLNMIDSMESKYFNIIQFHYAMMFIEKELDREKKVLINCNKGGSRSPSIAMVYLSRKGIIDGSHYSIAIEEFKKIYPTYNPKMGVAKFMILNWKKLMSEIKI